MTVIYELGPFRLDPATRVLSRDGNPVALGSRAVAVLTALVEHPNDCVSKDSIIDSAWRGMVVEEGNLAVQMSAIRRVLAEAPGGERWVETLARRGYRFVGPVTKRPAARAPAATGEPRRTNLPEPLTSFVGRERELGELKRMLPAMRLLTLVGIGGIGKTRLALEVAAELKGAYRDGVWFVDLAPLESGGLVPSAVGEALGVSDTGGKEIVQVLAAQIKGRELLLLLDNCEHLLEACARLATTVLHAAREITILATSREPLNIPGEQVYPLPMLSLPDPAADVEAMTKSEAVRLFVERAQRYEPRFELTADRSAAIAQLCIHLDGIPLALELAAARIPSLSIDEINVRLRDRFKLLTGGSRTSLPRQQTLRGALDWSHALLTERERVVLRRLAIFPGDFTLEAASAVASDESIDEFAVTDVMSQLVARSLLVADTSGAARYRLLYTTRAYALERLDEAGETSAVRHRHARYFRELFQPAPDDWLRESDASLRAAYVPERDNVRAALDWAFGAGGDPASGVTLAGTSATVWITLSLRDEGAERLEAAVARIEPDTPDSDQARLWFWLGVLWDMAPLKALAAFERARDVYLSRGDTFGRAHTLVRLARVLAQMGRFDESASALENAFPVIESAGLPKILGFYFTNCGYLRMLTGNPEGARAHYERAMSLFREAGVEFGMLTSLINLAAVNWALGALNSAADAFRESIALLRQSPTSRRNSLGFALANLSGVLTERGELNEALAAAREAAPLLQDGGYAWNFLDHFALRTALAGRIADAARVAGCADAIRTTRKTLREPEDARARERLQALLREKLEHNELKRLLVEGEKLDADDACRLALEA